MSLILNKIHNALAQGAIEKGWGGPKCYEAIPLSTHICESLGWVFMCYWFVTKTRGFKWYENLKSNIEKSLQEYDKSHPNGHPYRFIDLFVGSLHILMYIQLIYYKAHDSALIYLLQPCHPIMLLQGIALLSKGTTGVLITIFILPALTGTLLAMLFPEVDGLIQPLEMEAYWVQHYLIQFMPLYLLLRKDNLALKFATYKSVIAGLWILTLIHFVLLEVIDVSLMVNVDFILCPTDAMVVIFKFFPEWLFLPSYRTFMTLGVFLLGTVISFTYIFAGRLITSLTATKQKSKSI